MACVLIAAAAVLYCLWLIFGRVVHLMTWNLSFLSYRRSSSLWCTWILPLLTLMFGCLVTCGSHFCPYGLWSLDRRFRPLIGKFLDIPGRRVNGLWAHSFGSHGTCDLKRFLPLP